MKTCWVCGQEINSKFCPNCGTQMKNKLFVFYDEVKKSKYFGLGLGCLILFLVIFIFTFYFGYVRTHDPFFRNMSYVEFSILGYILGVILYSVLYVIYVSVYSLAYWLLNRKK